jgi:hypothetical protein
MTWINGETFYQLRQIDALYGPFVEALPNRRYLDLDNRFIHTDFQQPIDGYEAPWGNVPFAYLAALSVADPWTFPALAPEGWSLVRWGRMLTGAGALGPSLSLSLGLSLTVAIASTAAGYVTGKLIA